MLIDTFLPLQLLDCIFNKMGLNGFHCEGGKMHHGSVVLFGFLDLVFRFDAVGLAGIRGVEVVQQSHVGGGAGGVPFHPDAFNSAAHPAAPAAGSLLLHQLVSRHVPGRDPPHCGRGLLPYQRSGPALTFYLQIFNLYNYN